MLVESGKEITYFVVKISAQCRTNGAYFLRLGGAFGTGRSPGICLLNMLGGAARKSGRNFVIQTGESKPRRPCVSRSIV